MINILLVDDDPRIRTIIREYSQGEDWRFTEAGDGDEALRLFGSGNFSLVVLDVMMPRLDGWGVLKQLRQKSEVPVIMLTARDEEYDKLLGFELGVDDYMGKPFSPRELIARIGALLKRSGAVKAAPVLRFSGLELDTPAHTVTADGDPVALTPKEYDLLVFLASHPNIVFTREQLLDSIWGYDFYGDTRTVDTHVKSLREKLGKYREYITTVWGTGYRFTGGAA